MKSRVGNMNAATGSDCGSASHSAYASQRAPTGFQGHSELAELLRVTDPRSGTNGSWREQTATRICDRIIFARAAVFILVVMLAGCTSPSIDLSDQFSWDFESEEIGRLPSGWSQHQWGEGTTRWAVQEGESGKCFAQLAGKNPNRHFNMAVYDLMQARNVTLLVRFRAVAGEHDQGGGFVWRYQDEKNHYIVRANPLEDNVVLYKMQDGVRTDLPLVGAGRTYGVQVSPLGNTWHTLKLVAQEDEFTVHLDGQELFRVRDTAHTEPGKVGLWTKADAVTRFDNFIVHVGDPR